MDDDALSPVCTLYPDLVAGCSFNKRYYLMVDGTPFAEPYRYGEIVSGTVEGAVDFARYYARNIGGVLRLSSDFVAVHAG